MGKKREPRKADILEAIETLLRQFAQTIAVLGGDYQENYELLRSNYHEVFGQTSELAAIPLMMDIYYMFAPSAAGKELHAFPAVKRETLPPYVGKSGTMDPMAEFDLWFSRAKELILKEAETKLPQKAKRKGVASSNKDLIGLELDHIYTDLAGKELRSRGGTCPAILTPGYEREIRACIDFQSKNQGLVFPFIAYDPRRKGIVDLIKDGSYFGVDGPLVSEKGPFYGVKLYPRLGYLPDDIDKSLLDFCVENDTPMVSHSSPGGFPLWPWAWPWDNYGDPKNWESVCKTYAGKGKAGGLRLDVAHFGGDDQAWRASTARLISESRSYGPAIFSDVSCFTKLDRLNAVRSLMDADASLRGRVLFGTDFDVMLLTDIPMDLRAYFTQYLTVFGESGDKVDLTTEMMVETPRSFLKQASFSS